MSAPVIQFEHIGKKFRRTLSKAFWYGLQDLGRALLRRPQSSMLRPGEFWALHDVSFAAGAGECVGIIGPNGAGKTTLLRLVNREYRPEAGQIVSRGRVKSLIRLGTGLQPLLTGRENVYIRCTEMGFGKRETDAKLDWIVDFAGLDKVLDAPVKHYSDGMYARLEFSIATCAPMDILLIDEVLAVGDIAFQMRCLGRMDELKRAGTTILFVSHSEMNIRQVADRCLLLFDGEALGLGPPDALFLRYYEAVGYGNRPLLPLGAAPRMPADFDGTGRVRRIEVVGPDPASAARAFTGSPLELALAYTTDLPLAEPILVLQFWSSAGCLVASVDSAGSAPYPPLLPAGRLRVSLPYLPLSPGIYRVAGGFYGRAGWLGYSGDLLRLEVAGEHPAVEQGLYRIPAEIAPSP